MALKDWKPTKYTTTQYRMWMNVLPKYKCFSDNYYVTIGRVGLTNSSFISVMKQGEQVLSKEFSKDKEFMYNYKKAFAVAQKYMRSH